MRELSICCLVPGCHSQVVCDDVAQGMNLAAWDEAGWDHNYNVEAEGVAVQMQICHA